MISADVKANLIQWMNKWNLFQTNEHCDIVAYVQRGHWPRIQVSITDLYLSTMLL